MSQNHARTKTQIRLLSQKLADTVGREIFASLERGDQEDIFEQMLTSLYNCYRLNIHMTSWCGTAFQAIETLLSKLEKTMNQKNALNPEILLMAEKLTDAVGDAVFPFSSKEEKTVFFKLMLLDLSLLASQDGCVAAGNAIMTIETLLSKLD
jgi:hypothetical protein